MTDTKGPEQAAEEWIQTKYPSDVKVVGVVTNPERERDFVEGYQRGKADAEKRIWEAALVLCEYRNLVHLQDLKQIIFGGGNE